jgi:hypothetical protein
MSSGSPKLARREQAIEATRRRLRRLEIETHRIKAELARLEAEYEDDVADRLSRKLRRRTPLSTDEQHDESQPSVLAQSTAVDNEPRVLPFDRTPAPSISVARNKFDRPAAATGAAPSLPLPQVVPDVAHVSTANRAAHSGAVRSYRKAASPLALSLAVHAVAMSFCLTITVATLVQQEVSLFASPTDITDDSAHQLSDFKIEPTKFDDAELENVVAENPEFNIADNLLSELDPDQIGAGSQPLGDIGQLDALPGELGTLMAGAGEPGAGKPGGPLGEAVFFGARSKGDRFVFVVDNSSSMKGGRLEAAIAELLRATDALSPRQSFYVIFVSDQTYPMFFPQAAPDLIPATPPNKKRLAEWLPNAILASGNNRQLIKAMDMAAALRPNAVFLLWDGDMKYSEKVRLEVMTHLTRPNQWDLVLVR